jgi:hypothetical protein
MSRKEENPIILKWEENQKDPTQKEAKEKLTNDVTRNPISRKSDHHRDKNEIQPQGMRIFYG